MAEIYYFIPILVPKADTVSFWLTKKREGGLIKLSDIYKSTNISPTIFENIILKKHQVYP